MSLPKSEWPSTNAFVFSVDWFEGDRDDFQHYTVVYSYRVGEERYRGEFRDYIAQQDSYLRRDDTIQIRYDSSSPEKSYFPQATGSIGKRLLFLGIGAILALIVLLVVYLNGGFAKS